MVKSSDLDHVSVLMEINVQPLQDGDFVFCVCCGSVLDCTAIGVMHFLLF